MNQDKENLENNAQPPVPQPDPSFMGQAPPKEAPVRRAGTITMALALIIVGVALLAKLFVPTLSYVSMFRLAPLILVVLGIEILVTHFLLKTGKVKYDILSIFLCGMIIFSSFSAAIASEFVDYARQYRTSYAAKNHELNERAKSAVSGLSYIETIDASANYDEFMFWDGPILPEHKGASAEITPADNVSVTVYFNKEFKSKAEFVKACRETMDKLNEKIPYISSIYFTYQNPYNTEAAPLYGPQVYELILDGFSDMDLSAEAMTNRVDTLYWYDRVNAYVRKGEMDTDSDDSSSSYDDSSMPEGEDTSAGSSSSVPSSSSKAK